MKTLTTVSYSLKDLNTSTVVFKYTKYLGKFSSIEILSKLEVFAITFVKSSSQQYKQHILQYIIPAN